jgi:TPP-dependent indolepyruvate ferredoxin oxidoreductase alpha subunit
MNKIEEFLKLIPKAMSNPLQIIEGIRNDIKFNNKNLKEEELDEIVRRRLICNNCPLNSINAKESKEYSDLFNGHYSTNRTDFHCSICSCNIDLKTASLSSNCGLEYYNENNKDIQELKWTKYK